MVIPEERNTTMLTTWQSALDYLYGLTNWETRPPGTRATFELERIRALLADLGDPHHRWPAVHVGGTNGKGSTCAMIAAGLRQAGFRVGLYTSPHLHTVRERVQVDGELISEAAVLAWLNRRRGVIDALPGVTTFEVLTALAFDFFAAREVDVAVIEVGLGGRLDTTNVVRPALTVITPIGLDHTKVLGDTVELIARDKAGIFKPGVPAVVATRQDPDAHAALAAEARMVGAPLVDVGQGGPRPSREAVSDAGQSFTLRVDADWLRALPAAAPLVPPMPAPGAAGDLVDAGDAVPAHATTEFELWTPLIGRHQRDNAATAVAGLQVLSRMGWPISRRAVVAGLRAARWPARCECFRLPATNGAMLVIDGAHNPHAALSLAAALRDIGGLAARHTIFGFSSDKDVGGILDALLSDELLTASGAKVATVIVTQSSHVRALPIAAAAAAVRARGIEPRLAATPAEALDLAAGLALGWRDLVVATGSIFLAAEVRMACFERLGQPLPPHDPPRPE
jgi:dihydrofolate synthase/folylpolyglutamate synthase